MKNYPSIDSYMGKLPKLYRPVKAKFWSLRNKVGDNMGVIFDCDELVERTVMRVRTLNGWKWQIQHLSRLLEWDWCAETDQECLNDYVDLEFN